MKFYGREHELSRIKKELKKIKKRSSLLVLTGRRRIGKTRLVFEAHKDKPFLYFFVGKKKMPDLLNEWTDEIKTKIGNVYGEFSNFSQLLDYLFDLAKSDGNEITVFFDEVQNFLSIHPEAFSDLQKYYDVHRETSSVMIVFAGSSYSLVEKIFTSYEEPLFGRATEFIRLSYLTIDIQRKMLEDFGMYSGKNLLHVFSIFDGIPRFYEEIMETGETDFKRAFKELMVEKEFLWEEGISMMREEFGKDYSVYHSILSAIAMGRRARNEIEQAVKGSVGGHLHNLERIYRLIKKESPMFWKKERSSINRYYLADNFYEFWFRFMSRYQSLREINQKEQAFERIWELLPEYEGCKLEGLIKRIFIEVNPFKLKFTGAGRYWDRKGENEIDLILTDDDARIAYVVEVKRNLAKSLKREEKIKLYSKVSSVNALKSYEVHYLFAGIDNQDIVIVDEADHRFVL